MRVLLTSCHFLLAASMLFGLSRPGLAAESKSSLEFLNSANERTAEFSLHPDVRVRINAPAQEKNGRMPLLVLYALPNGNTIEETSGRQPAGTNEWRYGIQHIAAQTRFLRRTLTNRWITVAYLQAVQRSWPAWRKQHRNDLLPDIVNRVVEASGCAGSEIVLNGHSGGGSLIFGYLNALPEIPTNVVRICFLDSNYAYDKQAGHTDKLLTWLKNAGAYLCVFAYDDATALLNGKPFVSAAGGTWGRSQAMRKDFQEAGVEFSEMRNGDLLELSAMNRHVRFLLLENPKKTILHTVQVERNGFIHSLLLGTEHESVGYAYMGARAYTRDISDSH